MPKSLVWLKKVEGVLEEGKKPRFFGSERVSECNDDVVRALAIAIQDKQVSNPDASYGCFYIPPCLASSHLISLRVCHIALAIMSEHFIHMPFFDYFPSLSCRNFPDPWRNTEHL